MSGVVAVLAAALVLAWIVFFVLPYRPGPVEDVSDHISASGPAPSQIPGSLRVMTWNIQFAAGNRNNNFRITGGRDPWPERETVTACLSEVAAVIRRCSPDVVLLQEVDLGARRTHRIDQLQHLRSLLGDEYAFSSYCYYWKNLFCPHPLIMGSTAMGLVTLSKYPVTRATRYALGNLADQGLMRKVFGIKRAILSCEIEVGDRSLQVCNTHFDAFPHRYHVPTMVHQRDMVARLLEERRSERLTLVAGDFNLLPCTEHYAHLLEEDEPYYRPDHTEMTELYERFSGVPTLEDLRSEAYQEFFTHTCLFREPKVADKTTDYIFTNREGSLRSYRVVQEGTVHISDHFPLIAEVDLGRQ